MVFTPVELRQRSETSGRVVVRDIVDDARHREVLLVDGILNRPDLSFAKNC